MPKLTVVEDGKHHRLKFTDDNDVTIDLGFRFSSKDAADRYAVRFMREPQKVLARVERIKAKSGE